MGLLSPYNVEGKWSSAGAGDQGHTRNGNLATEQLHVWDNRLLGYVWTPITSGLPTGGAH